MAEATGSLADALKKDLEDVANAIFWQLQGGTTQEKGGEGDKVDDTAPEAPNDDEENDITPENLVNEAVRLLQAAEDVAPVDSITSGTLLNIADRYIYLAENV